MKKTLIIATILLLSVQGLSATKIDTNSSEFLKLPLHVQIMKMENKIKDLSGTKKDMMLLGYQSSCINRQSCVSTDKTSSRCLRKAFNIVKKYE